MIKKSLEYPLASDVDFGKEEAVMKSILFIIVAVTAIFTSSCNTFIGLGRDMRIAGEGMEKTANKASGGGGGDGDVSGAPIY